jgi:S1-C subfamily serine protease
VGDPDHTYVLTCKHVAPDAKHDYMVFSGPCGYRAEWVAADDRADLALLRINAKLKWAVMPAAAPAAGAPVWTEGCPGGGDPVLKTGTLGGGVRTTVDGVTRDWTTFSAPIRPGDSGAGVFSDGKLVGVAAAGPGPVPDGPVRRREPVPAAHQKVPTATREAPARPEAVPASPPVPFAPPVTYYPAVRRTARPE